MRKDYSYDLDTDNVPDRPEFYRSTVIKRTRKPQVCSICSKDLPAGSERVKKHVSKENGKIGTSYECGNCAWAYGEEEVEK